MPAKKKAPTKKTAKSKAPAAPRITRRTMLAKVGGISDSTALMMNQAGLLTVGDLLDKWIAEGKTLLDIEGMTPARVRSVRKNLGEKIDKVKVKESATEAVEPEAVSAEAEVDPAAQLKSLISSGGILGPGATPDAKALKGKVGIIRCGKAIDEETDLITAGADEVVMYNIDAEAELRARGLLHNGMTDFAIEYYFPQWGAGTYSELERALMADPRFKNRVQEVKDTIFENVPMEAAIWENEENPADSLSGQPVDTLGGGGVVYPGSLRLFTAVKGRTYAPGSKDDSGEVDWVNMEYDPRDDRSENPHLPERAEDVTHVSLLSDLVAALKRDKVDIAVVCGGFDGATGSSSLLVLSRLLEPLKDFDTVPIVMVTLPEYFLVDGKVDGPHADRLNAIVRILGRCAVLAGMGQGGIVWKAINDHVRTWGGLFSNVYAIGKGKDVASVLTIVVMPKREDMDTRYLLGLAAGSDLTLSEARDRLIHHSQSEQKRRIKFKQIPYRSGKGVQVKLSQAKKVTIHDWNSIMPALAVGSRSIGNMTIPLEVSDGGGFLRRAGKKTVHFPVAEVPLVPALMDGAGADRVRSLEAQPEVWALLKPELRLLEHHLMVPFETAFATIERDFLTLVTDDMNNTVFSNKVYNPDFFTYGSEEPGEGGISLPKTVVVWGVVDVGPEAYADTIFSHIFADVDRTAEEAERIRREEVAREKRIQKQTAQAIQEVLGGDPGLSAAFELALKTSEDDQETEDEHVDA